MVQESNYGDNVGKSNLPKRRANLKRVLDIILDENHPQYTVGSEGIIFYGDENLSESTIDLATLPTARPMNRNIFQVPCIGELVEVIEYVGDEYYPSLGGDPKFTKAYYLPPVNIHNNVGSNALPVASKNRKEEDVTNSSSKPFSFQKEFKASTLSSLTSRINQYLRDLGYLSGMNTQGAPKYRIFQEWEDTGRGKNRVRTYGDYIARLDDSEENRESAERLGEYFKENPSKRPVQVFEKDLVIQGNHGSEEGQYIRFTATTPEGRNEWSNNVTDVEDDGNPTVGDPLIEMKVLSPQTIDTDGSRVLLTSNQNLQTLTPSSQRVDSLNAEYQPIEEPLDTLAKEPNIVVQPEPETDSLEDIEFDGTLNNTVVEHINIQEPQETPRTGDPVFDALDDAQDEDLLKYNEMTFEDASDWYPLDGGYYGSDFQGWNLETKGVRINDVSGYDEILSSAPKFETAHPDCLTNITSEVNSSLLYYPVLEGKTVMIAPHYPHNEQNDPSYCEFGAFRGIRADNNKWRYHFGVDVQALVPESSNSSIPLIAVDSGKVLIIRGTSRSTPNFKCIDGAGDRCGGGYGNQILLSLDSHPNYAVLYGHCKQNSTTLKEGDIVSRGDSIALMGNSGGSDGRHLHFEILYDYTNSQWTSPRNGILDIMYNKQSKRNPTLIWPEMYAGNIYNIPANRKPI